MNDHDWTTDTRLDRLVDGELGPEEYREFLQALEREPDGWRRTAMAFLEAQAFGQDLAALRHEIDVPEKIETATTAQSARHQGVAGLFLAMAASFLVAFGLGAWWRSDAVRSDCPSPRSTTNVNCS